MLSVCTGLICFFPLWVIYNNFSTVNCHEVFWEYYSINPLWVSMPVDKWSVNCTPKVPCVHVIWAVQKRLSYWWRRPIIQTPIRWCSTVRYVAFFLLKVVACKAFHVTLYINAPKDCCWVFHQLLSTAYHTEWWNCLSTAWTFCQPQGLWCLQHIHYTLSAKLVSAVGLYCTFSQINYKANRALVPLWWCRTLPR